MKKIITMLASFAFCLALCLSLTGCGSGNLSYSGFEKKEVTRANGKTVTVGFTDKVGTGSLSKISHDDLKSFFDECAANSDGYTYMIVQFGNNCALEILPADSNGDYSIAYGLYNVQDMTVDGKDIYGYVYDAGDYYVLNYTPHLSSRGDDPNELIPLSEDKDTNGINGITSENKVDSTAPYEAAWLEFFQKDSVGTFSDGTNSIAMNGDKTGTATFNGTTTEITWNVDGNGNYSFTGIDASSGWSNGIGELDVTVSGTDYQLMKQ